MKKLTFLLLSLLFLSAPVLASDPLPLQPVWRQAPTELSLQGVFAQDSTSHLWQGIVYASMGSYLAPRTFVGGQGSVIYNKGINSYLIGPTLSIVYPVGLKDWDLVIGGDANAPLGDASNQINWQAVTRLGMRYHLGREGASIQPGLALKRAFGVNTAEGGQSFNSVGLYLTISLGINPPSQ